MTFWKGVGFLDDVNYIQRASATLRALHILALSELWRVQAMLEFVDYVDLVPANKSATFFSTTGIQQRLTDCPVPIRSLSISPQLELGLTPLLRRLLTWSTIRGLITNTTLLFPVSTSPSLLSIINGIAW